MRSAPWGTEWHSAVPNESEFQPSGGSGVYEIPLGSITSVDTPTCSRPVGRLTAIRRRAPRSASWEPLSPLVRPAGSQRAEFARSGEATVPEVQNALREQGALIDVDDLPEAVDLQKH